MAEPITITFVFNKTAFEAKLVEIKKFQIDTYAGKKGVNPHQWLYDNIKPLEVSYNNGIVTKELYDSLMNLNYKVVPEVKGPNKFVAEASARTS